MARPQTGDEPINVSFNCKITETESQWLNAVSYVTGLSKSEVIRRAIKFAYVMVDDASYRVRKEEEKQETKYSIREMKDKVMSFLEDHFDSYFDDNKFIDDDDFLLMTQSGVPKKTLGSCLDEEGRKYLRALRKKHKEEKSV